MNRRGDVTDHRLGNREIVIKGRIPSASASESLILRLLSHAVPRLAPPCIAPAPHRHAPHRLDAPRFVTHIQ